MRPCTCAAENASRTARSAATGCGGELLPPRQSSGRFRIWARSTTVSARRGAGRGGGARRLRRRANGDALAGRAETLACAVMGKFATIQMVDVHLPHVGQPRTRPVAHTSRRRPPPAAPSDRTSTPRTAAATHLRIAPASTPLLSGSALVVPTFSLATEIPENQPLAPKSAPNCGSRARSGRAD